MLVTGAANAWNVPAAEIETSNSVLTHASGRHATYGEMAEAAGRLAVPEDVRLKKPSQFTLIGKQTGTPRVLDASGKLAGWQHTIVGQSIFGGTALASYTIKDGVDAMSVEGVFPSQYAIPQMRGGLHSTELRVPPLWLRCVGNAHRKQQCRAHRGWRAWRAPACSRGRQGHGAVRGCKGVAVAAGTGGASGALTRPA